jgi:putative tryptophan/tyrosine transport system substrate-binding protein
MRRREFLGLLGGVAIAQPLASGAQPSTMPLIGFLSSRSKSDSMRMLDGFRRGLAEVGLIESQNVAVTYRWAEGKYDRLPALAAELLGSPIAVLVAVGGEPTARAAVGARTKTPVVTVFSSDPVSSGLVDSLSRPGHNVTGVSILSASIEAKRIGLLHDLLPQSKTFGALLNPATPTFAEQLADVQSAAHGLGIEITPLKAPTDQDLETAFATVEQQRIAPLLVSADPFLLLRRTRIITLAETAHVPVMYPYRDFADAGGLMSYGVDLADAYRQMAVYAGRIITGDRPEDLPVAVPTKFEFVINLKAAKSLGITIAPSLLAIADEVIE